MPTTEAGPTCYIHYYAGGYPPTSGSEKHDFPVLINVFLVYEKFEEKCRKKLEGFFYFLTNSGKNLFIKILFLILFFPVLIFTFRVAFLFPILILSDIWKEFDSRETNNTNHIVITSSGEVVFALQSGWDVVPHALHY